MFILPSSSVDPGCGGGPVCGSLSPGGGGQGSDPLYATEPQHAAAQHQQRRAPGETLNAPQVI